MIDAGDYLTVASLLSGFGVTVLMFRIERELHVQEIHPEWETGFAWADYLVIVAILISLLLVVVPLIVFGDTVLKFSGASCGAAVLLLAAYPFAISDHYRLLTGTSRNFPRRRGEPIEKAIVIGTAIISAAFFVAFVHAH